MFTVFYAWQSDREQKLCRSFIRQAAEVAVEAVATDAKISSAPSFDHDTKGEPGLVEIANTVKRKIRQCGVFLADVTSVAEYTTADQRQKFTMNPNVSIELGYALRTVDPKRIILIMNTAFGAPEHLPFDLQHYRHPICYKLADPKDPLKRAKRKELTKDIADALRLIIGTGAIEAVGSRELRWKISVSVGTTRGNGHIRKLWLDLTNIRHTLNDVVAFFEIQVPFEGTQTFPFHFVNDILNPFPKGCSARAQLMNIDPAVPLPIFHGITPSQVDIVVKSHFREVLRIPATQWAKQFSDFCHPDPSLPARPNPLEEIDEEHGWRRLT